MSPPFDIIAQLAADHEMLYFYGPLGVFCAWLMLRVEKLGGALLAEMRIMSHRFDGVQRALLISELNREDCHPSARRAAQEQLAKIEAREQSVNARNAR